MAARRISWHRALEVHHNRDSGINFENDENVDPMLGNELELVQETTILVRLPPRHHPRLPLRDITHLFHGNTAALDDKAERGPPATQTIEGARFRRLSPPSSQNPRKRRQVQAADGPCAARSVLRKTFR